MTGVEIILILAGLVMMIGSFMVTEKLSGAELDRIAELSQNEIKKILENKLKDAETAIEDQIDHAIEDSTDKVERALDKETNEKMLAIGEYSDTVMEKMNQTHNEIMFLYSMLNDKHTELTKLAGQIGEMSAEIGESLEEVKESVVKETEEVKATEEPVETEAEPATGEMEEQPEQTNHNGKILALYSQGKSYVEIAKELGLGQGEVRLVVGLYKGVDTSEV